MSEVLWRNVFVKVVKKGVKRRQKTQNVGLRPHFSPVPAPLPIRSSSRCDIGRAADRSAFVRISLSTTQQPPT